MESKGKTDRDSKFVKQGYIHVIIESTKVRRTEKEKE